MKVPWILFPALACALPRLQDFECNQGSPVLFEEAGDECSTQGFSGKQINGICRQYDLTYLYCSIPREDCREEYDGMPCWQKSPTEDPTRFARCLDEDDGNGFQCYLIDIDKETEQEIRD